MKIRHQVLSLLTCLCSATVALAQGTAFTYQGRLGADGAAASGYYDLRFELFGTESNPLNAFGTFTTNHVAVANGLFTVRLDFGSAWDGNDRWLEIAVKTNGAGTFTTLAPRQKVTPTPYAIRASHADGMSWSGLSGVPVGAGLSLGGGNTFNVNFGASGAATTAARSDHDHFGQSWLGTAAAGLTLRNQSTSTSATGLLGLQGTASADDLPGIYSGVAGISDTLPGYGVMGIGTGLAVGGVYGSGPRRGTFGFASGEGLDFANQPAVGVLGHASGTNAIGVRGYAFATTGSGLGVSGQSDSPDGTGVFGLHNSTSGTSAGVQGVTKSLIYEAVAVLGVVDTTEPGLFSAGVRGVNKGTNYPGIGVYGSHAGSGFGVFGKTPNGIGLVGLSQEGTGVFGISSGTTTNGYGVDTKPGVGVVGEANVSSGPSIGVRGNAISAEGVGVSGYGWLGTGVQGSNYLGYQASLAAPAAAITASAPQTTNTAVRIERGALQVVGAGVGTPTPAFIHVANSTNTSGHITSLYHPLCDGEAGAILIVTPNWSVNNVYNSHPIGVYFTGSRWAIFNQDFGAMSEGAAFNVLVIKP